MVQSPSTRVLMPSGVVLAAFWVRSCLVPRGDVMVTFISSETRPSMLSLAMAVAGRFHRAMSLASWPRLSMSQDSSDLAGRPFAGVMDGASWSFTMSVKMSFSAWLPAPSMASYSTAYSARRAYETTCSLQNLLAVVGMHFLPSRFMSLTVLVTMSEPSWWSYACAFGRAQVAASATPAGHEREYFSTYE